MLNKKFFIGLILMSALFAAQAAFAGPGQGWGRAGGFGQGCAGANLSQLEPEQREALRADWQEHRSDMQELHARVVAEKAELDALMLASETTGEQIDRAVQAVTEAHGAMLKERVAFQRKLADEYGMDIARGCGGPGREFHGRGGCPGSYDSAEGYGRGSGKEFGPGDCPGRRWGGGPRY